MIKNENRNNEVSPNSELWEKWATLDTGENAEREEDRRSIQFDWTPAVYLSLGVLAVALILYFGM